MYPVQRKLKKKMRAVDLTVREVAERLKLLPTTLSSKLNGYAELPNELYKKILEVIKAKGGKC